MKQVLLTMALLIIISGSCLLFYVGLLSILVQPGNVNHANGFTIERSEYINTRYGRVVPVIVEDSTSVTYTVTIHK